MERTLEVIIPDLKLGWHRDYTAEYNDSQICRVYRAGCFQDAVDKHSNFFDDINSDWTEAKTPRQF